jgi:glycosyltransferase involved in cell wall biosynthesis
VFESTTDLGVSADDTRPAASRPDEFVSIVICTRNRADKIANAVGSVLANDYPAFDVTVIDQSTDDATAEALRGFMQDDKRLHYTHTETAGLSRAYNEGVRRTSGEIIAFTDDDCVVPGDWLRSVSNVFNDNVDVDLVYGQVLPLGRKPDDVTLTPALGVTKTERLSRRDGFRVYGMGANFAARRRLFDAVGGFDEVLGGGAPLRSSQDFDLAYRTYRAGSVILLSPDITLLHDGRREPEDWPTLLRNYGVGDGAFYSKHVRCGDVYAFSLLVRRLSKRAGCVVAKTILGREKSDRYYLRGMLEGIRESRKFRLDRQARVYKLAAP